MLKEKIIQSLSRFLCGNRRRLLLRGVAGEYTWSLRHFVFLLLLLFLLTNPGASERAPFAAPRAEPLALAFKGTPAPPEYCVVHQNGSRHAALSPESRKKEACLKVLNR